MKRTPLKRYTALRSRSKKREKEQKQRRELVIRMLEDRPWCEALPLFQDAAADPDTPDELRALFYLAVKHCTKRAVDLHERLPRGRGGNFLDPEQSGIACLCRMCHTFVTNRPEAAYYVGLLRRSNW